MQRCAFLPPLLSSISENEINQYFPGTWYKRRSIMATKKFLLPFTAVPRWQRHLACHLLLRG